MLPSTLAAVRIVVGVKVGVKVSVHVYIYLHCATDVIQILPKLKIERTRINDILTLQWRVLRFASAICVHAEQHGAQTVKHVTHIEAFTTRRSGRAVL